MMNNVMFVGRLVADPELKETENQRNYTQITLAIPRTFKNSDGVYETDFVPCILWQDIAKNTAEYCKKGDLLGVKGRMQTTTYKDKDGNSNVKLEVIAERVTFLASKEKPKNYEDRDER